MKKIWYLFSSVGLLFLTSWILLTFFPEKAASFLIHRQVNRIPPNQDFLFDAEGITVFTVGASSPLPGNWV